MNWKLLGAALNAALKTLFEGVVVATAPMRLCRTCWEKHNKPSAYLYAGPSGPCAKCNTETAAPVWVAPF